jgi:hypothetical protein
MWKMICGRQIFAKTASKDLQEKIKKSSRKN